MITNLIDEWNNRKKRERRAKKWETRGARLVSNFYRPLILLTHWTHSILCSISHFLVNFATFWSITLIKHFLVQQLFFFLLQRYVPNATKVLIELAQILLLVSLIIIEIECVRNESCMWRVVTLVMSCRSVMRLSKRNNGREKKSLNYFNEMDYCEACLMARN